MKKEENFGCKAHHQVFFSKEGLERHFKEKGCHPENVIKLKGEDFIGRMSYNIISEQIDNLDVSEQEKEQYRQAYLW